MIMTIIAIGILTLVVTIIITIITTLIIIMILLLRFPVYSTVVVNILAVYVL